MPMTPEEHQMLAETRALAEENAKVLKNIQRHFRVSSAIKVLYWVIVLGVTFGAFYLIQPYVNALKNSVSGISGEGSDPFTISGAFKTIQELQSLYK
jgi:hypothetical protein